MREKSPAIRYQLPQNLGEVMKVGSGSESATPRHVGAAPRTPSLLPLLLLFLLLLFLRPGLFVSCSFFAARVKDEKWPSGIYETYQTLRHVRELAGKFFVCFFFLPLFLQNPSDINPNPSFLSLSRRRRVNFVARRAWPGRVESPREIEPSKKFRNRALNSGSLSLSLSAP